MEEKTKEQKEVFLKEYIKLCDRHGLYISSCGCCDSPWILEGDQGEDNSYEEHLKKGL